MNTSHVGSCPHRRAHDLLILNKVGNAVLPLDRLSAPGKLNGVITHKSLGMAVAANGPRDSQDFQVRWGGSALELVALIACQ